MGKTQYVESSIAQLGVGKLEIYAMSFFDDQVGYAATIEVRSLKVGTGEAGWGKRIFRGTLEELIDLIITKIGTKEVKG
mgnify:CR=1 FL=1